jgi:hypothetical protein
MAASPSLRETRLEEKNDLQGLNIRLESYGTVAQTAYGADVLFVCVCHAVYLMHIALQSATRER